MTRRLVAAGLLCILAAAALAPVHAEVPSPREQLESGVPPEAVQCRDGLVLVVRGTDDAICVREETAAKKGWDVTAPAAAGVPHPITHKEEPKAAAASEHAGIVAANNAFALDFYRQISGGDGNVFFSPTSIYLAFSILYEGAGGDTAAQMGQAFGFDPDEARRHNDTARMMASLNRDDPHATLNVANALWIADRFGMYDSYLDVARGAYLATAETVDFTEEDDDGKTAVRKINAWASENTNERIKEVIEQGDVDGSTEVVITNAVYFKGSWEVQFPENATKRSDFHPGGADVTGADFMNVFGTFDYARADGVQVLKLQYRGDRLSMTVILPDDAEAMRQLDGAISAEQVGRWSEGLESREVMVSLPKFEARTGYDLIAPLVEMGVHDVFGGGADLRGMGPSGLYVNKATHDAYVKVNEEGTEAAAFTAIMITTEEQPPPPHFNADRPFVFLIQDDESGAILFMGKITDPS